MVQFTGTRYGQEVKAGGEASIEYQFFPSPQLDPIEFQMAFTVFYEDSTTVYGTTFFNETVTFADDSAPLDLRSSFKLVLLLSVIGVIGFALLKSRPSKSRSRGGDRSSASTAVKGEYASEFLQRQKVRACVCAGDCFRVCRGVRLCVRVCVCVRAPLWRNARRRCAAHRPCCCVCAPAPPRLLRQAAREGKPRTPAKAKPE